MGRQAKAKEEAERQAREEAERKAQEEAERQAKEDWLKAKEEANRAAQEEAERMAKAKQKATRSLGGSQGGNQKPKGKELIIKRTEEAERIAERMAKGLIGSQGQGGS